MVHFLSIIEEDKYTESKNRQGSFSAALSVFMLFLAIGLSWMERNCTGREILGRYIPRRFIL